jgi:hypothetical protein
VLNVEQISNYLRVTGYVDGSDWLFLPTHQANAGFGMAGPHHIWACDRAGRLELFDAQARRHCASVELGQLIASVPLPLAVGRDGRTLFILHGVSPAESRLKIIDIATGAIEAEHTGLPGLMLWPPLECPDGRLLLAQRHASLILLDPATGTRDESQLAGTAPLGFLGASPDGRYWIRFDQASLPIHDESPGLIGRLFKKGDPERRYGLTVQIWEAFPLTFRQRTVVAWLTAKELPDESHLPHMKNKPAAITSRRVLWDTIAATAAANADAPTDGAPPRSAYPPAVANDAAAWKVIEENLAALARDVVRLVGWQPDETAFWVNTHNFLSCVGLDNTVSPRLYTERRGLTPGTVRPVAMRFREVVPLADRKARVTYDNGAATFDGAPSKVPERTVAIPLDRDDWHPRGGPADPDERARSAAYRRVEELKARRREVVVSFAGWSEAECLHAIDALTNLVADGEVHRRAIDRKVQILFDLGGERIPESRFFREVGARFPGAAPAICRLIERFADASGGHDFLFDDEQGNGVLADAVKAVGTLDRSSLPTLKRYGLLVDAEHEYFFAGTTVPAIITAHGWTDDVVDFVFWVLVRNYYNTLQEYGPVWESWGLREAVVRRDPRVFARHLVSELADIIRWVDDPGRYGSAGLEKLAKEIPQPHEPWAQAFFDELSRAFPER